MHRVACPNQNREHLATLTEKGKARCIVFKFKLALSHPVTLWDRYAV